MFLSLAYAIVQRWWPTQVMQEEAARFTNTSLDVVLAMAALMFILYRVWFWRLWRMTGPEAVRTLRGPWWLGWWLTGGFQFVTSFILGLLIIIDKDFGILVAIFLTAFFTAIIAQILFWILSLISSPQRCWLAPPLRKPIFHVLGIIH